MTTTSNTWHGTTGGYTNHSCRCDRCREAWKLYKRRYRDLRPERARNSGRLIKGAWWTT